jgi:hypothetical protein
MKMKLIAAVVAVAAVSQAGLINWTQSASWGEPTTVFGGDVSQAIQDGWQVSLYNADVTGGLDINTANLSEGLLTDTAANVVLAPVFAKFLGFDGVFDYNVTPDFANVFTVVFDAADKGSALNYMVVDTAAFNSGDAAPPATSINYNVDSPISTGATWAAIPEPATIGLMGIAGMGMFLARRKVRR